MDTILHSPLYVPLQKKSFDIIEVNLMTDTVSPVPFSTGNSHTVLQLKRVGLLDGLQKWVHWDIVVISKNKT